MDRDTNLLFGVVSVQYEQITSTDFVRAVEAWVNEPARHLSAYLVEAGALSESDLDFVDNIVDKELKECGGDPAAALERVGGDEAIHLASRGYITLIGTYGLKVGHPEQQPTGSLAPEAADDEDSSASRYAVETEVVAWRLIGIVSLALLLLSTFVLFSYWRIGEKRNEAVIERDAAREAHQIAEERLNSAERQRRSDREALLQAEVRRKEIERERYVAKRQRDLAMDAIKKNVFEMPGRPDVATDANPASFEILRENIAVLDRILDLEPDSISLQIEKSVNQALVGALWKRLGEPSESVSAYEEALSFAMDVSEQRPDETHHRRTLAIRHRELGGAYTDVDASDKALAEFEKSLRIDEELLETDFDVCELREALAKTHVEAGNIHIVHGARSLAVESYEKSLDFNEKLLESDVQYGAPKRSFENPDTIGVYEEAVALWRASLESNRNDLETQSGLAQSEQILGLVYAYYGSYDDAQLQFHNSLSTYLELSERGTLVANFRQRVARIYYDLGLVHSIQESFEAAKAAFERAIAIANDLFDAAPERTATGDRLAAYTFAMGRLHLGLREYESASARFGAMLEIYRRPSAKAAVLFADAGSIYAMYSQAHQELRHLARAEEALQLREAYIGLLRYFAEREPDDAQVLTLLADIYVKFGISLRQGEQTDRARESFKYALDILQTLASKDPNDAALRAKMTPVQLRLSRIDENQ